MPDLLGATNPIPGYDKAVTNRNVQVTPQQNPQLQNIPDLTKVVRADGRTEQQSADLQGQKQVRYDSNFQTFVQRLMQAPNLMDSLMSIFSGREGTVVLSGLQQGIAAEMGKIMEMAKMDEGQLAEFLKSQVKGGTLFGGSFCALLRRAYGRAESQSAREDILQFLKGYSDYLSSGHVEKNIVRNMNRMAQAIPSSWGGKLQEMIGLLENGISGGDREGVVALLQKAVIPYMGKYVEQTHDMGTPRQLLSQLALDVVRYENGSEEKILQQFHQLKGYASLRKQLDILDDQMLLTLLRGSRPSEETTAAKFSQTLTGAASKALKGEGSQQVQEGFKNLLAAMLVNESVYMPLNHYIVPLQWNGNMLFSEIWVDPDSQRENGDASPEPENNTRRILIKVDVQKLGLFDILLVNQKSDVQIQIACPQTAEPFMDRIQKAVTGILLRNELNPVRVAVSKMERPVTLTEVFPKIFQGRNSVNVKA